jgi:mannose-6-phosphate isomerase-like protein (cupin superfamily)
MRRLLTGVDDDGRSCLVEVTDVVPTPPAEGGHGVNVARVHVTTESPPLSGVSPRGPNVDVRLPPGIARWIVVEHPPYDPDGPPSTANEIHHTDTFEMVFVHDGAGELLLDDGAHAVSTGDLVVMPGVDHAMRGGPEGLSLVVVSIGTGAAETAP